MCDGAGSPVSVSHALAMLHRALDHLNAAGVASLPSGVQAEALRSLERAEAKHTSARSRVLAAFTTQGGFEDDGHGTARTWLKWQTQITSSAAASAVGWARRLAAHLGEVAQVPAGPEVDLPGVEQQWAGVGQHLLAQVAGPALLADLGQG
jgi:hypothetical protein